MTSRFLPLLVAGTVLAALAAPAFAEDLELLGDGSDTNNPDLLRGSYECGRGCDAGPPIREPYNPFFEYDWSVALRASYVDQNGTARYETSMVPALTLSHVGLRSSFAIDAEAEIVKPQDIVARIAALRFSAASTYMLDEVTDFSMAADVDITQGGPTLPVTLTGTAVDSRAIEGEFTAGIARDIGIADIGLRGNIGRVTYTPTSLYDGTVIDNTSSNDTWFGGGLRIGHRLTPRTDIFADVSAESHVFDAVSPTYLVKLDGTDYAARIGFTRTLGEIFEAEASVGVGLRQFADPTLTDVRATLYEAALTWRPTETLTIATAFETSIEEPGTTGSGFASVDYEATADVTYQVNSWWALRGSAEWYHTSAVGVVEVETGYSLGAGSDYQLNGHVALTADYEFSHDEVTATPAVDTHKVTVGVKVSR